MIDHGQECQSKRPRSRRGKVMALAAPVLTTETGGQLRETRKRKGSQLARSQARCPFGVYCL